MKKVFLIALPICIIAFAVAATALYHGSMDPPNADSPPASYSINTAAEAFPEELEPSGRDADPSPSITTEEALIKYVLPYGRLRVEAQDWTDPEQIDPDKLVRFGYDILTGSVLTSFEEFAEYYRSVYPAKLPPSIAGTANDGYVIPQLKIEAAVAEYFDVASTHLRRSSLYDQDRQAYVIVPRAPDEDAVPQVTAAMRDGGQVAITINLLTPTGPWQSDGNAGQYQSSEYQSTLIMTVEDLDGASFRYKSALSAQQMESVPAA